MRPPKGYDSNDKPLPHEFDYKFGLSINSGSVDATTLTFLRTSKISVDPSTIEVHRKNSSFAVDAGPLVCYDSIIPQIEIVKSFQYDYGAIQTNKIPAVLLRTMKFYGHHKDTWDAIDPLSSSTPQTVFNVTKDDTNEDVIPTFDANNLIDGGDHPLSTVTGAEVFGDYGLTADATMEHVARVIPMLDDAEQYKIIANKLKTMHDGRKTMILSPTRSSRRIYERRFVPKQAQFADEDMYYGEHVDLPAKSEQGQITNDNIATTAITHVWCDYKIRFNEWNKDFDQRRM